MNSYKSLFEYLPVVLVGLLFVTDSELEKHAVNTSCQLAITIAVTVTFFSIALKFKNKIIAFSVAVILWVLMVHMKKMYIVNK